jgi:hypothetical protein
MTKGRPAKVAGGVYDLPCLFIGDGYAPALDDQRRALLGNYSLFLFFPRPRGVNMLMRRCLRIQPILLASASKAAQSNNGLAYLLDGVYKSSEQW